jgi:hypothetical protein
MGTFTTRYVYEKTINMTGSGADPFALDGTFKDDTGTASSWNTTGYTSTYGNLVVYIAIETNGGPVTGVTGGGITFTKRANISNIELWCGTSVAALTNQAFAIQNNHELVFSFRGVRVQRRENLSTIRSQRSDPRNIQRFNGADVDHEQCK